MSDVTFRLIALDPQCGINGQTALTADLARLVPGGLNNPTVRKNHRLGIERTDWSQGRGGLLNGGGLKPIRSVLIDAESEPGEWEIGAGEAASESEDPPIRRVV